VQGVPFLAHVLSGFGVEVLDLSEDRVALAEGLCPWCKEGCVPYARRLDLRVHCLMDCVQGFGFTGEIDERLVECVDRGFIVAQLFKT
jgi:hypothetical protein